MTKTATKSSKAKDKKPMIAPNKSVPPVRPAAAAPTDDERLHPDFEEVSWPTSDGHMLNLTLPKNRVPSLARPGMAVSILNQSQGYGVVVEVLDEWCIVRNADGEQIAVRWAEVELTGVQPDPAFIRCPADEQRATAQPTPTESEDGPKIIIPIGARVAIQTGEEDRLGTVVAALEQCCVVRLDDSEDESSVHAAADWAFIRPLNMGGEGAANHAA
jgi:hypothetical protein